MSNRGVRKGLSLLMTMLLCVTSFNFSLIAQAGDAGAARIIGFNPLDESIATQSLPVGASIDDVVFPDSIRATVETVGEVEVQKAVERAAEEEPVQEEKAEESVQTDEAEPVADEVSDPVGKMINEPTEGEASETEESQESTDETPAEEVEEPIDTGLIDILFPAIIANAEELDESEPSPIAGAVEVGTPAIEPKTEYETVIETRTVQSEITIENVKWEIADGAKFDSTKAATYTFAPVFSTDYVVAAAVPIIKVNIVNADSKISFDKSVVIDGVRISVKADEGVFPEGSTLSVEKVYGSDLQAVEEAVDEERAADKNKVESYTFDIKILDKDGNEIEPDNSKGQVKVSFTLEEVADVNLETDVYHVKGEVGDLSVDKLDAEEVAGTTVEAVTDGFSFYTVEFTYNNLQYVMQGGTTVALADILTTVGLQGTVTNAVSDAPELFSVANTESGWMVTANKAFTTEQKLTVSIDGKDYVIVVTDDLAPVSYLEAEWNETTKTVDYSTNSCTEYSIVESSTTTWGDGKWYVVAGTETVTVQSRITVSGTVNLILKDGATLDAQKGISVGSGATLNIYAQSKGDAAGKLIAKGYERSAGIGGNRVLGCGIVTINGGIIEATGDTDTAGIGGGYRGTGGTVTINGGTVIATGGDFGAGIGGGYRGAGATVTINGGEVTATGGNRGAGIGGGERGAGATVTINGGEVTATGDYGGAGIGGGYEGSGGDVTINGGIVTAIATSNDSTYGAGIGGGFNATDNGTVIIATGLIVSAGIDEASAGPVEISQFIENHNQTWVHIDTAVPFSSLNKYDVIQAGLMLKNDTDEEQQVLIKHKSLGKPTSQTVVADDTCRVPFTMIAAQVKDASGKYNICGTDEIVFESSEYTVGVGETKNDISLKFAGYDITAANENFTFKSDNEDIATVNSDGAVTGNAAGTTKITATLSSDPSFVATCNLNVGAEATQKTDADVIDPPEGETTGVDTDTKPEVSDEFSEEAKKIANETGDDVELKLVVAPQGQSKATESEFLKNDEEMHDKVKSQFKDEESVEVDVLDINIKKTTNNSESLLSETSEVLGICIGYNFSGKFDPVVVRKHGSSSNPFRALSSVPTGKYQDGTFFADTKNHKLYIYSMLFSEYVIAYSTVEGNAQNRTVATTSTSETPIDYPKTVSVYRLFNTKTGDHLFTANIEERNLLLQQHAAEGWTDEGIAFETAIKSDIPVYRLFDAKNGIHFYTANITTRDTYIANGCTDEGIAWYAPSNTGRKVYKLTDAKSGKPLYTISKAETDALANAGFACEDADFVVF